MRYILPKRRPLQELHVVTCQKTAFFSCETVLKAFYWFPWTGDRTAARTGYMEVNILTPRATTFQLKHWGSVRGPHTLFCNERSGHDCWWLPLPVQLLLGSCLGLEQTQVHYYCGHLLAYRTSIIDDNDYRASSGRNEWQEERKCYEKKNYPSAALSTIDPTWLRPGSNPGRHGGELATNCLSYGKGHSYMSNMLIMVKQFYSLLLLPYNLMKALNSKLKSLPSRPYTVCVFCMKVWPSACLDPHILLVFLNFLVSGWLNGVVFVSTSKRDNQLSAWATCNEIQSDGKERSKSELAERGEVTWSWATIKEPTPRATGIRVHAASHEGNPVLN
jgi:hypothetical protein